MSVDEKIKPRRLMIVIEDDGAEKFAFRLEGDIERLSMGTGSSGSEVGLVAVLPSGMAVLQLGAVLSSGTRLALEAIGSAASSGYVTVSLIP